MRFIHCPWCGERLIEKEIGDEGLMPYCEHCARPVFDMIYPCVIVAVVNEFGEIALLRQGYVSKETYVCVAGYMKSGESAETTAQREVEEEIGLPVRELTYVRSYPFEKKDMLMLGYKARVDKREFVLSSEVDAARWFSYEDALCAVKEGSIAQMLILDSHTI